MLCTAHVSDLFLANVIEILACVSYVIALLRRISIFDKLYKRKAF